MFSASNIHYEVSERTRGVGVGGMGAIHKIALSSGLVEAIEREELACTGRADVQCE